MPLFIYDRIGYRRHARHFAADDLAVDLGGRTALVTGANSGIGLATATALAGLGAEVVLGCRSVERGRAAATAIGPRARLELVDMTDLDSVAALGERVGAVDFLVHNAGLLPPARALGPQGLEHTLACHVVGPHLLTTILAPRMPRGARIIWITSGGMYTRKLSLRALLALSDSAAPYDGTNAYADTKRAQVVLARLWAKKLAPQAIDVNAMHPGWADTPALASGMPRFQKLLRRVLRSPAEGADTVIWLAAAARLGGQSGRLWFDRAPVSEHKLPFTRTSAETETALWALADRLASGRASRPPS
jgi:NAD(P)-dependent dehydrogenase (short-subunit alcohol dehydrogenase family)